MRTISSRGATRSSVLLDWQDRIAFGGSVVAVTDPRKERVRQLFETGFDLKAAIGPLVAITGRVQHIHLHLPAKALDSVSPASGAEDVDPVDEERARRLMGIRARLIRVPGGQRKVAAFLRREFGKAEPEDLWGADLERLYGWVHSLPVAPAD